MYRYLTVVLLILLTASTLMAEECSVQNYGSLVSAARSADEGRLWSSSAEIYSRILRECADFLSPADMVKSYDALAVAELMNEKYSASIDNAKRCLDLDSRCNSCMMTAAQAYVRLGDRDMAMSFARSAVQVGAYDDYSAAVVILAKDFIKKLDKGFK